MKKRVDEKVLRDLANVMRRDSLISTTKAKSGHPTTCLSAAEIISTLFFKEMKYDTRNSKDPDNDEFILSKGHAAPILYSALHRSGCIHYNLDSLRKFKSPLEGHPVPRSLDWIKVATGSLGQGLSVGVGYAIAAKLQKRNFRTYVLLGDSEVAEGSVYEACELAAFYKLNNLCAIIDINRLGQSNPAMLQHNIKAYKKRFLGFGWNVIDVNGHNITQLIKAFNKARKEKIKPTIILAKTFKGKGVDFLEDKEGWHGKPLDETKLAEALIQIPNPKQIHITIERPVKTNFKFDKLNYNIETNYNLGDEIATREAYGIALAKLAKINLGVIATDGETSNSTKSEAIKKVDKTRFIEAFIAEQNMVGLALGLSVKGYNVFASTFAAFFTRAHDQIRMAGISSGNLTFVGSHVVVSIGSDGASQMALEDFGMFRPIPNSIIICPSDAVSTEKLVVNLAQSHGIKYLRTTRPSTLVIYKNKEEFPIGEFKIIKKSMKDSIILIGTGITVHECLKAYEKLKSQGINVCVVDCYSIKPFNSGKLIELAKVCDSKIITVEDHYIESGIGEMIASEVCNFGITVNKLAVKELPHSGEKDELFHAYGIDSDNIIKEAKRIIKGE